MNTEGRPSADALAVIDAEIAAAMSMKNSVTFKKMRNTVVFEAGIAQLQRSRTAIALTELIEAADNALRVHRGEGGTKPNAWSSLAFAIARAKGEQR